jgi:hypothetical protein
MRVPVPKPGKHLSGKHGAGRPGKEREMRTVELPWWQHNLLLCGNEGEGDGKPEGKPEGEPEGDPEEKPDEEDEGLPDDKDVEGLKSALQKERKTAKEKTRAERTLAKQLAEAQKKLDEIADKDKSEGEKATKAAQAAQTKVAKLAEGLKKTRLDAAIEKVARELKFKDTDDAISLVDRSSIEVEQDEDDPSDITIDAKTVKAAVKALADKKKHLVGEEGSDEPSGSKFPAGGGKDKTKLTEEDLRNKYPALQ